MHDIRQGKQSPQSSETTRSQAIDKIGLGTSIAADGGLAFIRSHVEDKLSGLFDAAVEQDPSLAAAGSAAFFDTSMDVSPQATGMRIASFAFAFFQTYKTQNPELSGEDLVSGFRNQIVSGLEDGFAHAEQVLSALELLDGEIKANVEATYKIVMAELESSFAELLFENTD